MAITYNLAPIPKWYLVDNNGKPLGGGKIYTYYQIDKDSPKNVYKDMAGSNIWENPIIFDANGTQGPFYWSIDSSLPNDLYYLRIYDSNDVFLFDIENFAPTGSGGGGGSTIYNNFQNFIVNNLFWRNIGTIANPTTNILAPGCHEGISRVTGDDGRIYQPDIYFTKDGTGDTDSITFKKFLFGETPFSASDVTPPYYLNYVSTGTGTESYKNFVFPIISNVNNFSSETMNFVFWGKNNSGNNQVKIYFLQFFGSASGSAPNYQLINTFNLTGSWAKYSNSFTVDGTGAKTEGLCGNSFNAIIVQMPLNTACDNDFAKSSLYLGDITPESDFTTFDMINGIVSAPRTGDVRIGLNSFGNVSNVGQFGWVPMNDGTIGKNGSGATTRADLDTFPLFNLIWNLFSATPTLQLNAPMFNGITPIAYGGSAIADFIANRRLSLTYQLGRVISSVGIPNGLVGAVDYTIGTPNIGEQKHTQTIAELATHNHTGSLQTGSGTGAIARAQFAAANTTQTVAGVTIDNAGSSTPFNVMQPTSFMNFYMKL